MKRKDKARYSLPLVCFHCLSPILDFLLGVVSQSNSWHSWFFWLTAMWYFLLSTPNTVTLRHAGVTVKQLVRYLETLFYWKNWFLRLKEYWEVFPCPETASGPEHMPCTQSRVAQGGNSYTRYKALSLLVVGEAFSLAHKVCAKWNLWFRKEILAFPGGTPSFSFEPSGQFSASLARC